MKKIFLSFFLSFCFYSSFSQSIKLFAIDAKGRRDSVSLGFRSASLGIDSSLGEINIFGKPFDTLDIRVIQRDSANFHCIRKSSGQSSGAPNLYFPNNTDSKIDYRPRGTFDSIFNNFEIIIHGMDYPILISGDFRGIRGSAYEGYSRLYLLNNKCNVVNSKSIFYYNPNNDSLFTLIDSSFNTLVANFQHEVLAINENDQSNNTIIVYPNPVENELNIICDSEKEWAVNVVNILGQSVYIADFKKELKIDVSSLKKGMYFLNINDKNLQVFRKPIIIK